MCRSLKKSSYQLYQLFYHRGKSPLWHSYQSALSLFWHNSLFLIFLRGNFYHRVAFFMFWQGCDWHLKSLSNNQPFSNMEQHANTSDTTGLQQHSWNRSWNKFGKRRRRHIQVSTVSVFFECLIWLDLIILHLPFRLLWNSPVPKVCGGGNWHWFSSSVICGSVFFHSKLNTLEHNGQGVSAVLSNSRVIS